jgi:hypothetical protein
VQVRSESLPIPPRIVEDHDLALLNAGVFVFGPPGVGADFMKYTAYIWKAAADAWVQNEAYLTWRELYDDIILDDSLSEDDRR